MQDHVFRPTSNSTVTGRLLLGLILGPLFLFPAAYKLVEWYHVNAIAAAGLVLAVAASVVGLAWFGYKAWFATTTLSVEGGRLVYQAWGRRRSWSVSDVAHLVRGDVLAQHMRVPSERSEQLLFISQSGRCFFRLGSEWPFTQIGHAISVPVEPMAKGVITAGDAARAYPGSYSWLVANPGKVYLLTLGVMIVGFFVFVVVVLVYLSLTYTG